MWGIDIDCNEIGDRGMASLMNVVRAHQFLKIVDIRMAMT
jgi:hypothetical protein